VQTDQFRGVVEVKTLKQAVNVYQAVAFSGSSQFTTDSDKNTATICVRRTVRMIIITDPSTFSLFYSRSRSLKSVLA
jgi:hypothetical protein